MGQQPSTPSDGPEDPSTVEGPARASATVLGLVSDSRLQRDSMTSVRVGDRQFWTSRDSTCFDGEPFFFFTSTASWTDFDHDGRPRVRDEILETSGENNTTYFPTGPGRHPPHGNSGNGQERWLIWPDSPPLPVAGQNGTTKLYTWIKNAHQDPRGERTTGDLPSTSLYRSDHMEPPPHRDALPPATLVNPSFWPSGSPSYGAYGWVLGPGNRHAYLYAHTPGTGTSLARVPPHLIEEPAAYSFYSPRTDSWLPASPSCSDDPSALAAATTAIPNAGTGEQGTFYHSSYFGRYVWIGGRSPCNSEFQVATAPEPWGPWTVPRTFYVAPPGERFAGYSWQAHPGLCADGGNGREIYLTFTRINRYFENVLIRVEWF